MILLFYNIKSLFLNISISFLRICLYFLRHFIKIVKRLYILISKFKNSFYFQKTYKSISKEELRKFLLLNEFGKVECLFFPKIFNLSLGGEMKVFTKGIQVYQFSDISFVMNSDFIRFNNQKIFCDKITRPESIFNKFGDADFISFRNNEFNLITCKKNIYFDYIFHMTGCFSRVWSHFIVQFFSKLNYLYLVPKNEAIVIILPDDIDSHILRMINFFIKDMENVSIKLVTSDTEVFCNKLIYVSLDTWLSDDSFVSTLFHMQISDFTSKFVLNESKKMSDYFFSNSHNYSVNTNKKLFIGRTGKRNIENYTQVLEYFKSLGFVEIFPHLLTIEQKIELFSNAEFITGPASTGFSNIIFCRKKPAVLVLVNFTRHDDMLLTKFAVNLGINYQTFIGKETTPGYLDSDYHIDMIELEQCVLSHFSI